MPRTVLLFERTYTECSRISESVTYFRFTPRNPTPEVIRLRNLPGMYLNTVSCDDNQGKAHGAPSLPALALLYSIVGVGVRPFAPTCLLLQARSHPRGF